MHLAWGLSLAVSAYGEQSYIGNPFEHVSDNTSVCYKRVYSEQHLKDKAPRQTVTHIAAKLYIDHYGADNEYSVPMMRLSVKVRNPNSGSNQTVDWGSLKLACSPNDKGTVGRCFIDCDGPNFEFRYSKIAGFRDSLIIDSSKGYISIDSESCGEFDTENDEDFSSIFLDNSTNVDDVFRLDPVNDEQCDFEGE
jgi:hypothetical protein